MLESIDMTITAFAGDNMDVLDAAGREACEMKKPPARVECAPTVQAAGRRRSVGREAKPEGRLRVPPACRLKPQA